MPFHSDAGIRYFQFEHLGIGLEHAVFTRIGGSSPKPWESLNLGGTVGDEIERVRENRRNALKAVGRNPEEYYDVWQVHGMEVAIAEEPRSLEQEPQKADVILTKTRELTIMMRFADCVPILLHDPVKRIIGLVHAGWMGSVLGTTKVAVESMQNRFGCRPADIRAGIGPSIGPDHYEIGVDVVSRVRQSFGKEATGLLIEQSGSIHFDLWEANRLLLEKSGVEQIETAGLCTACNLEDWYSHRGEKGRTGRFGAIMALTS